MGAKLSAGSYKCPSAAFWHLYIILHLLRSYEAIVDNYRYTYHLGIMAVMRFECDIAIVANYYVVCAKTY